MSKFKLKQKLSRVPSTALRQAVRDLELVEKHPDYVVDMGHWHHPITKRRTMCHVCLAGSVIARRTTCWKYSFAHPDNLQNFDKESYEDGTETSLASRLRGLDSFRVGDLDEGLKNFGYETIRVACWQVPPYATHPESFKSKMLKMATYLESLGA